MTTTKGWTSKDIKLINDLLIKANDKNLEMIKKAIYVKIAIRREIKRIMEVIKK